MTVEQKAWNRFYFRIAAFLYFLVALFMAFTLVYMKRDVTGFAAVIGTLSVPIGALLVTDMLTTPKVLK